MSCFRSASYINLADFYRALPSRQPETMAEKQANEMMTFRGSPAPVKPIQAGPTFCPTCGQTHRLGTVCSKSLEHALEVLFNKGVIMSGNKRGNPGHHSSGTGGGRFATTAHVETSHKQGEVHEPVRGRSPEGIARAARARTQAATPSVEHTRPMARPSSVTSTPSAVTKPAATPSAPEHTRPMQRTPTVTSAPSAVTKPAQPSQPVEHTRPMARVPAATSTPSAVTKMPTAPSGTQPGRVSEPAAFEPTQAAAPAPTERPSTSPFSEGTQAGKMGARAKPQPVAGKVFGPFPHDQSNQAYHAAKDQAVSQGAELDVAHRAGMQAGQTVHETVKDQPPMRYVGGPPSGFVPRPQPEATPSPSMTAATQIPQPSSLGGATQQTASPTASTLPGTPSGPTTPTLVGQAPSGGAPPPTAPPAPTEPPTTPGDRVTPGSTGGGGALSRFTSPLSYGTGAAIGGGMFTPGGTVGATAAPIASAVHGLLSPNRTSREPAARQQQARQKQFRQQSRFGQNQTQLATNKLNQFANQVSP